MYRKRRKWYHKPVKRVSPTQFRELRRTALAQPALIDVLEIFSGKVIEIRVI